MFLLAKLWNPLLITKNSVYPGESAPTWGRAACPVNEVANQTPPLGLATPQVGRIYLFFFLLRSLPLLRRHPLWVWNTAHVLWQTDSRRPHPPGPEEKAFKINFLFSFPMSASNETKAGNAAIKRNCAYLNRHAFGVRWSHTRQRWPTGRTELSSSGHVFVIKKYSKRFLFWKLIF